MAHRFQNGWIPAYRHHPAKRALLTGRSLLLAIAVSSGAVPAGLAQTVYKVTDKEGNVTFTDAPPSNTDSSVETQTVHATNTSVAVAPKPVAAATAEPVSYETVIVAPAEAATIPMGPGNFSVEAMVRPALSQGERVVLTLDGEPVGTPQQMATWQLTNVYRGEHRLQVVRVDGEGATVNASSERTVYVMRPTANR